MAITVHYCTRDDHGSLIVRSNLLAFRHITTGHSGAELAEEMIKIFSSFDILHKVSIMFKDLTL